MNTSSEQLSRHGIMSVQTNNSGLAPSSADTSHRFSNDEHAFQLPTQGAWDVPQPPGTFNLSSGLAPSTGPAATSLMRQGTNPFSDHIDATATSYGGTRYGYGQGPGHLGAPPAFDPASTHGAWGRPLDAYNSAYAGHHSDHASVPAQSTASIAQQAPPTANPDEAYAVFRYPPPDGRTIATSGAHAGVDDVGTSDEGTSEGICTPEFPSGPQESVNHTASHMEGLTIGPGGSGAASEGRVNYRIVVPRDVQQSSAGHQSPDYPSSLVPLGSERATRRRSPGGYKNIPVMSQGGSRRAPSASPSMYPYELSGEANTASTNHAGDPHATRSPFASQPVAAHGTPAHGARAYSGHPPLVEYIEPTEEDDPEGNGVLLNSSHTSSRSASPTGYANGGPKQWALASVRPSHNATVSEISTFGHGRVQPPTRIHTEAGRVHVRKVFAHHENEVSASNAAESADSHSKPLVQRQGEFLTDLLHQLEQSHAKLKEAISERDSSMSNRNEWREAALSQNSMLCESKRENASLRSKTDLLTEMIAQRDKELFIATSQNVANANHISFLENLLSDNVASETKRTVEEVSKRTDRMFGVKPESSSPHARSRNHGRASAYHESFGETHEDGDGEWAEEDPDDLDAGGVKIAGDIESVTFLPSRSRRANI
ncbi:hypothetical protein IAU59_002723 [Kwoniella sp. CBS 9459]